MISAATVECCLLIIAAVTSLWCDADDFVYHYEVQDDEVFN